jgi:Tfp pilus assembly protein PilN
MPNINLIAARREEKKKLERLTRQLFFGLTGSIGVLVALGLYLTAKELAMSGELREAEARMQTLQPKLDRIKQIETDQVTLKPKVQTLQDARTDTLRWRAVLQAVSQSIPGDTWLSGLSTTGNSEDTSINLSGISASQTMVGETMLRLGVHPLFDHVELKYTQTAPVTTQDPVQRVAFEIVAHLRGKPQEEEKKDGKTPGSTGGQTQKAQTAAAAGGNGNG